MSRQEKQQRLHEALLLTDSDDSESALDLAIASTSDTGYKGPVLGLRYGVGNVPAEMQAREVAEQHKHLGTTVQPAAPEVSERGLQS